MNTKRSEVENDDIKYAEGKLSIIVLTNAERTRINEEKLEKLLPNEKSYVVYSITNISLASRCTVPLIDVLCSLFHGSSDKYKKCTTSFNRSTSNKNL